MNAQEIRKAYLDFFATRGHAVVPRAKLVLDGDPTTLFTGSGMQPMIPYLLGETHPAGVRLVDSQTCLRAQDIDDIGDNRHTTFFEMLGNWSLGDYFKKEQIPWFWEFMTEVVGLDPSRLYVTCYIGDDENDIPKDTESAQLWVEVFKKAGISHEMIDIGTEENGGKIGNQSKRIAFYGDKNWWARNGMTPKTMTVGEPGGPDTEMFYLFPEVAHNKKYGEHCHHNCDCGRYIEIGNSVFMQYLRTDIGFQKLPKENVDFGAGLERIAQASINSTDMFKVSVIWPIIDKLQVLSGKDYESHTESMRVIADHLRAATFLAVDGCVPSNKEQGYVMRRLLRRAIRYSFDLGIEQNFLQEIVPIIADLYHDDFPEVAERREEVIAILVREEKAFRQTIRKGIKEFNTMADKKDQISGDDIFVLYDTYGFPVELAVEEAFHWSKPLTDTWRNEFEMKMNEQRQRSQTAQKGAFKGGLAGHDDIHKKYHTATHLMYKALRMVLGDHVIQRGSNITDERLRFDFSHPEKVTREQCDEVERIVNEVIAEDLPMTWREYPTDEAFARGALGAFGDKYGDTVKVYQAGPDDNPFSFEICGGPHVDHTGQLADGGKRFVITKEEASSAGIRRIKAVLR
ncbi:MAG: alanine--tRNA ligase [Candidatus Saccharimonadales bacterium]